MEFIVAKIAGQPRSSATHENVYSSVKEMKQEGIFRVFVFLWSQPTRDGRHGSRVAVEEWTSWVGRREAGVGTGPQGLC